jgi:hypothetical protein
MPPVTAFGRAAKNFPALLFARVEPEFEAVVMRPRPGAATIYTAR